MALNPHKRGAPSAQSQFDEMTTEQEAELAFRAHTALMKAQAADHSLIDNPYFDQLRHESYERFLLAWGRVR